MQKCTKHKRNGMNRTTFNKFLLFIPKLIRKMPLLFGLLALFNICHSATWCMVIFINEKLVNILSNKKISSFGIMLMILSLYAVSHIVKQIFNGLANFIPILLKGKMNKELDVLLMNKVRSFSAKRFEEPAFLDAINKAETGKKEIVWEVITFGNIVFFYIPYFVFISIYMSKITPMLIFALAVAFLPSILTMFVRINIFSKYEDKVTPIRRKSDYYKECIVGKEFFKDTRCLGLYSYLENLYVTNLKYGNELKERAEFRINIIEFGLKLIGLLGYVMVIISIIIMAKDNIITIGVFSAMFQGVTDIYKLMEEFVFGHISGMARDIGKVNNYIDFLNFPIIEKAKKLVNIDKIVFDKVSFCYEDESHKAVKDISIEIEKGEKIAVVGKNGSGKSTFTKLLLGLYNPTKGKINYYDGLVKYDSKDVVCTSSSAVFQNYMKYKCMLDENVYISDVENISEKSLSEAITNSGLDINFETFPLQEKTLLSKEFGGEDISGGQWQRVAIARGIYRSRELIVLDEPTSAIDPIEETKLYNKFNYITKGKTSIIVTHRLGAAKIADRILVFDDGEIVADGKHDELIENCEYYRNMYIEQKRWYK